MSDKRPEFIYNYNTERTAKYQTGAMIGQGHAPVEKTWREKLSDGVSDFGTRTLNAVKTFGGSAVGDAIHGVSPEAAENVEKYTGGFIPYTKEQELIANRSTNPDRWKNRTNAATDAATNAVAGVLTDGLVQKIPGAINAFKAKRAPKPAALNWGKWNAEIPANKELMQEYAAIERTAKANGTWMKNPDGSAFMGTSEQFVQQNSGNFKKFFTDSKIINGTGSPKVVHHGGRKGIETFIAPGDEGFAINKGMNSATKDYGIYFAGDKGIAKRYLRGHSKDDRQLYEAYLNIKNPYRSSFMQNNFSLSKKSFKPTRISKDNIQAIGDSDGTIWRPPYGEYTVLKPEQIKSAVGNNGMFNANSANIYKVLIPAILGGAAAKYQTGGIVGSRYGAGEIADRTGPLGRHAAEAEVGVEAAGVEAAGVEVDPRPQLVARAGDGMPGREVYDQPVEGASGDQAATMEDYVTYLNKREMSGRRDPEALKTFNRFGYVGAFQMGSMALEEAGLLKKGTSNGGKARKAVIMDGKNWVGGEKTRDMWLGSWDMQKRSAIRLGEINKKRLEKVFAEKGIVDRTDQISYMMAAHLGGSWSVKKALRGGEERHDGNGVGIWEYRDGFMDWFGKRGLSKVKGMFPEVPEVRFM